MKSDFGFVRKIGLNYGDVLYVNGIDKDQPYLKYEEHYL
jgi:hypothetical protein